MIHKLIQQYRGFQRNRLLEKLNAQLQILEDIDLKREELPYLLAQFWQKLDTHLFEDLTLRQLMCAQMDIRHPSITALVDHLFQVNDACATQNDAWLENFSRREFRDVRGVSLDMYFVDNENRMVDLHSHLLRVKGLLQGHVAIIGMYESSYYPRLLNRLYYDIVVLTRQLINQL